MFELRDLSCGYDRIVAVRDLRLTVDKSEVLAILGANGAGKTSTLMAIAGHINIFSGAILLDGEDITRTTPMNRCARGVSLSPEGRRLFRDLTVYENLVVGGYAREARRTRGNMERVLDLFPRLQERLYNLAGSLSGGEQQMVAIARAMMAEPRLLLIDEVSLGLMPKNIDICYSALDALRRTGLTIIVVEQSIEHALALADQVCVLESGALAWSGSAADARGNRQIIDLYMGGSH